MNTMIHWTALQSCMIAAAMGCDGDGDPGHDPNILDLLLGKFTN